METLKNNLMKEVLSEIKAYNAEECNGWVSFFLAEQDMDSKVWLALNYSESDTTRSELCKQKAKLYNLRKSEYPYIADGRLLIAEEISKYYEISYEVYQEKKEQVIDLVRSKFCNAHWHILNSVDFCNLSNRLKNKLNRLGVRELGEVLNQDYEQVIKIKGFGSRTVLNLIEELKEWNEYSLKLSRLYQTASTRILEEKSQVVDDNFSILGLTGYQNRILKEYNNCYTVQDILDIDVNVLTKEKRLSKNSIISVYSVLSEAVPERFVNSTFRKSCSKSDIPAIRKLSGTSKSHNMRIFDFNEYNEEAIYNMKVSELFSKRISTFLNMNYGEEVSDVLNGDAGICKRLTSYDASNIVGIISLVTGKLFYNTNFYKTLNHLYEKD